MIIAIDFDGTCVKHKFPKVGEDIGAQQVLKDLTKNGHKLILFTMRGSGKHLDDALRWFRVNKIPLFGINKNPTQSSWTTSPKPYANYYIDDAAVGCPLVYPEDESEHPWVDWEKVREYFENEGLL